MTIRCAAIFFISWATLIFSRHGNVYASPSEYRPTRSSSDTSRGTVYYAIVIGNNAKPIGAVDTTLSALRHADDDAARYYQLLRRVAKADLLSVLDAASQQRFPGLATHAKTPTIGNLRAAVANAATSIRKARAAGNKAELYFVFTGHGARTKTGEAFFALADAQLTTAILYNDILAKVPATRIHVIIDACHAQGVIDARGGYQFDNERDVPDTRVPVTRSLSRSRLLAQYPHVGLLLATSSSQSTYEWSGVGAGVFSHVVLSGLQGPADINGDRRIEYSEIQAFVASANSRVRDRRAVPQVIAIPPRVDRRAAVLDLNVVNKPRFLVGAGRPAGHFTIETDTGVRVADANLGGPLYVLLPERTAYIHANRRYAQIPDSINLVALKNLTMRKASRRRGSIDASLHSDWFSVPYDRNYYSGFVDSRRLTGVSFAKPRREQPTTTHNRIGKAALATAAASGVATIVFSALAWQARRDFFRTNLERPSIEARNRYHRYLGIAIGSAALATVSTVVTKLMWESETTPRPAFTWDSGQIGLGLSGRF